MMLYVAILAPILALAVGCSDSAPESFRRIGTVLSFEHVSTGNGDLAHPEDFPAWLDPPWHTRVQSVCEVPLHKLPVPQSPGNLLRPNLTLRVTGAGVEVGGSLASGVFDGSFYDCLRAGRRPCAPPQLTWFQESRRILVRRRSSSWGSEPEFESLGPIGLIAPGEGDEPCEAGYERSIGLGVSGESVGLYETRRPVLTESCRAGVDTGLINTRVRSLFGMSLTDALDCEFVVGTDYVLSDSSVLFPIPADCESVGLEAELFPLDGVDGFAGDIQGSGLGDPLLPDAIVFLHLNPANGLFVLDSDLNSNYKTCDQCVLIFVDITQDGVPARTLFQTGGFAYVNRDSGSPMRQIRFDGLVLREASIADDFTSTVVPGGLCVGIDTLALEHP